jgi:ABC-type antimicrobial peptide transport system permease subunit
MQAVGYQPADLQRVFLAENLVILFSGLGIGLLAAVISIIPYLALGGQLGSLRLGGMLVLVVIVGLAVVLWGTAQVARTAIIPALRRE